MASAAGYTCYASADDHIVGHLSLPHCAAPHPEDIASLKTEHTTWTACNTFTTGQAMTFFNRLTLPGMTTNIDLKRAGIRTDTTLHASCRFWDNITFNQRSTTAGFWSK